MPDKTIVLTGAGGVLGSAFASALGGENLVRLGRDVLSPAATNDVLRLVVQIPTQAGHLFRFDRGHPSDLKPATIPI